MFKRLAAVIFFGALAACATTEQSVIDREVRSSVKEGMPKVEAVAALESLGFACTEGRAGAKDQEGLFECLRNQQNILPPFACLHRVWFESHGSAPISKLDVWRPSCAGM